MKFKYKEQTKEGKIIEGIVESPDMFTLAKEIRERGSVPLSVKESDGKDHKFSFNFEIFGSVSLSEKIMFTNNLSGMLSAGLSLTRAMTVLEKQTTNKTFNDILKSLIEEINKGGTLSGGMAKFPKIFSGVFVSMVHWGEESGNLPGTLKEIGTTLKKTYDLNKKIKGALMYPSIIVGAIFLIGVLMMIYVVPTLTKTFTDIGVELPAATRFIIFISDSLSQHFFLFALVVGAIGTAGYLFAKLKFTQRYFDLFIIKIPMLGTLIKEMNTARTTRTLASLLSSGVDLSKALAITEEVLQNVHYKELIHNAIISIEKGIPLSTSFKEHINLYPIMVGEMIEVGEETGKLSSMLSDIATFYESEVDDKTKNLSTIIEPVLMIFIGGAVGFFAIAMIKPMYSVMDNIN
ncbi:type II secretion system F family protein [Candidatus Nomurabacteria bacterium]|nr:type II secretion system F family protein [Candidatus Nomurabacteria bacterium]